MHNAMSQAATLALTNLLFTRALGTTVEQFLVLHVTRDNIVQDTIHQLIFLNSTDLKKPLRVSFKEIVHIFIKLFSKLISVFLGGIAGKIFG